MNQALFISKELVGSHLEPLPLVQSIGSFLIHLPAFALQEVFAALVLMNGPAELE